MSIWYDWKDDGNNPKEKEHRFGIVGQDFRQEKATYQAAKTLSEQLRGFRFKERLPLSDSRSYLLVFEKNGELRYAAWTSSKRRKQAKILGLHGVFWETDYLGRSRKRISTTKDGLFLELEEGPKYLLSVSAETASSDPGRAGR